MHLGGVRQSPVSRGGVIVVGDGGRKARPCTWANGMPRGPAWLRARNCDTHACAPEVGHALRRTSSPHRVLLMSSQQTRGRLKHPHRLAVLMPFRAADLSLRLSSPLPFRSMIPHKTARGAAALERLKSFEGVPHPYDKVKRMVVPDALKVLRLQHGHRNCKLGDLSASVGAGRGGAGQGACSGLLGVDTWISWATCPQRWVRGRGAWGGGQGWSAPGTGGGPLVFLHGMLLLNWHRCPVSGYWAGVCGLHWRRQRRQQQQQQEHGRAIAGVRTSCGTSASRGRLARL